MPLWDKLKTELDRAGKAAQVALDEVKLRLEVFREKHHKNERCLFRVN